MPRGNFEVVELFRAKALTESANNVISSDFPLGEGITRLRLDFAIVLANTTGTGAISEGELNIIKAINFKNSKGERFFNNVPGRALYRWNQAKAGTAPVKDAIAATAGTYRVFFDLWFIDPMSLRPMDTIFDSSRYKSVELSIQLGSEADLLTSVGDAAATYNLTAHFERIRGGLPEGVRRSLKMYQEIGINAPVNPANQTYIDLERAENLAYKRLFIQSANSATSGVSHSGTPNSSVISDFTVEDNDSYAMKDVSARNLNAQNKVDYGLESAVTGNYIIDFVKDGSNKSALFSGNQARQRVKWNNDTLSTSQVSMMYEALRDLR